MYNDRELLAKTLMAEAGNQGPLGMLAAGSVIMNRVRSGNYGQGLPGVILKPGAFSPWNSVTGFAGGEQGQDMARITPNEQAYRIADALLSGQYEDPTGNATHFYNPDISDPSWGIRGGNEWRRIGEHVFGRADDKAKGPSRVINVGSDAPKLVASDTMAALGKGGGAVTPDQIAQGAQAQSTGMQDEQRPRGLLGNLFGNPDTMANLALAFNSMRLNPDPNLGAVLTAQMKERRDERKSTAKQNRTLDYLRSLGTPQAMQAIRYAEGTGDIAGALKMATATAKDDRTALIKNFQFAKEQGYPGSFQDFLKSGGGGGSVINIGGEDYKVVGDQVVVPDPNSPAGVRFVPIPGGKTALAAEAETQRLATSQQTKAQKESIVTKSIDRLIGMLDTKGIFNLPEAGIVGSTLGGLGINQEAVDFKNELMTVQSNVAFDRLQQMREASKTGGALGAVSERELDLLISAYGNLQQSSSPKILRENLEEIKRIMTKIENDPVASSYYYNGFTGAQGGQSQSQEGGFSVTGKVGN